MPSSQFVIDILKQMSAAVQNSDEVAARELCSRVLSVELGKEAAEQHLAAMLAARSSVDQAVAAHIPLQGQ